MDQTMAMTLDRNGLMTITLLLLVLLANTSPCTTAAEVSPVVEIEEDVYTYADPNNGAGPMWCSGSTCLVRSGERTFATGFETVPGIAPLDNCRWFLSERQENGWHRVYSDTSGLTREPSPAAVLPGGRVFVSVNPATPAVPPKTEGVAHPDMLEFRADDILAGPKSLSPTFLGTPKFTEHSYRTFAADSSTGELLLFQNVGYAHAEWTFFERSGKWSAHGQLKWPWGAEYEKPQPIRICYPNVALHDRAVHFVGVSDIVEPKQAWREFKRELTGRDWDYDFRRLFYTWTPDITQKPFAEWVEIASREETCGWIMPGDLWLAPSGDVHIVWTERAIDPRLREKFFPAAKQSHSIGYARLHEGQVIDRRAIVQEGNAKDETIASAPRLHATPDNRLFLVYLAAGRGPNNEPIFENRIQEILPGGTTGQPQTIAFTHPFINYFTATVRAGSPPSHTLEMLGQRKDVPNTISYARVRLAF